MNEEVVFGDAKQILTTKPDVSTISKAISNVVSILFSNLEISLQNEYDPLNQILVVSLEVPVSTEKSIAGYVQDISLGITKSQASRVFLGFDLAGTMHTIEYSFEANFTKEPPTDMPLSFRRFFSPQGVELASQSSFGLKDVKSYPVTLYLSVQRRSTSDIVLVSIDGIDTVAVLI